MSMLNYTGIVENAALCSSVVIPTALELLSLAVGNGYTIGVGNQYSL